MNISIVKTILKKLIDKEDDIIKLQDIFEILLESNGETECFNGVTEHKLIIKL